MKKLILLILLLITDVLGNAQVEKQLIVVPKKSQVDMMEAFLDANQVKIVQHYDQLGWYLVKLSDNHTQDSFIRLCKDFSFITKVYKDEKMTYNRDYVPNDSQFSSQWYLKQITDKDIDADLAWDLIPTNNVPTKVAIFDGGNDVSHEDLIGNIVTPFNAVTNLFSNGELVDPLYDKHGTSCSGTIAAVTNNGLGVASVGANKVKVMPINIMTSITSGGSFGTSTAIQINAINAAMAQGCVAINMSYGGDGYSQALNDAFIVAKNQGRNGKGLFICASSGNGYSGTITQYPASYSAVYGIGATTSTDVRSNFSNYGNIVDISAPGSSILTTDLTGINGYSTGNYATVSGTSFSSPITAAAGALILYKNPNLSEASVMEVLASTAEKVGGYVYTYNAAYPLSTRSVELGYGRINLNEALKIVPLVGNPIITPPTPEHNFVIYGCSVSNSTPLLGSTITITTNQKTTAPQLTQVAPKLQYRLSTDNIWSVDDIIIGVDTSFIGGGVESQVETITYSLPGSMATGIKYILIKSNFDGAITESTTIDNTCSVQINVINPGGSGTDLMVFWTQDQLVTCATSTQNGTIIRFKNVGSAVITNFTWRVRWETCPIPGIPSYYICNSILTGQGSLLQPNQLSGTYTFNHCLTGCGLSSNPYTLVQLNETRNMLVEITSVNGLPTDDFIGNNTDILPITRIPCTQSTNGTEEIYTEQPVIKIYTITGMLVDKDNIEYLSSGIYIIHYQYSDHTDIEKIIK